MRNPPFFLCRSFFFCFRAVLRAAAASSSSTRARACSSASASFCMSSCRSSFGAGVVSFCRDSFLSRSRCLCSNLRKEPPISPAIPPRTQILSTTLVRISVSGTTVATYVGGSRKADGPFQLSRGLEACAVLRDFEWRAAVLVLVEHVRVVRREHRDAVQAAVPCGVTERGAAAAILCVDVRATAQQRLHRARPVCTATSSIQ